MPTITTDQLAQLQQKLQTLVTDKADADAKTQASNQADTALAQAQATSNQARLDEQTADTKVSNDLLDLQAPPTP